MELSPDNLFYIAAYEAGRRQGRLMGRREAVVSLLTAPDPVRVDQHRERVEGMDLDALDALLEETFLALEAR
mgnify:CR=1 FL=1